MASKLGIKNFLILVLAVALLSFPFMPFVKSYFLYVLQSVGIGIVLALGLNLSFGYCGQINFGVAAPYAIAAYSFTLLQIKLGLNFLVALPISLVLCWLVSWIVFSSLSRLRHHYLGLGTLAFAMVVWNSAERFKNVTGGEDGLSLPKPSLFGQALGETFCYYFVLICVVVSFLICYYLVSSRVGYAMKAIKEDEIAASVMGINVNKYRRLAFLVCSVFCGLAGILFAHQTMFISPANFSLWTNITAILMVIIGGLGSNFGAVVGGAFILLLSEFLGTLLEYQVLFQGLFLLLVIRFLPNGIAPYLAATVSRLSKVKIMPVKD